MHAELQLQAQHVSKSFGGVKALDDVSLSIRTARVHALVGENGAGKSTLLKILAGLISPDSGEVMYQGNRNVAMIHQELTPFPDLSVAENICMGRQPTTRFPGWIDRRAQRSQASTTLAALGVSIGLDRIVRTLSVAEIQLVEIARALARNADVVLMDEPTSALSSPECESLMGVIRTLAASGKAVVYTSHRLDEILNIADEVTVLRDGHRIASSPIEDLDEKQLIALMVGRDLEPRASDLGRGIGDVVLEVVGLRRHGTAERVSFVARRGEVLGFAGLMGAGRTELASTIFGLLPREEGEVRVNGALVHVANPSDAMRGGIMMLPEDRKRSGIVPGHSILENMTLASLRRFCRGPWIDRRAEREAVRATMRSLEVKARRPDDQIETLSGGNQQKVLIARALLVEPEVLILDEPTRGIDIGAKAEIHGLIRRFARSGKAVIMLSSELPEILSLSDRVLVMRGGAISAELDPHRTTEHEILTFAMPANAAGQPDHAA